MEISVPDGKTFLCPCPLRNGRHFNSASRQPEPFLGGVGHLRGAEELWDEWDTEGDLSGGVKTAGVVENVGYAGAVGSVGGVGYMVGEDT